jgi:heterodisulfide reductase subunit A-like polyferredoxin
MTNNCLIIGGEIAALRAAKDLIAYGISVTLVNPSKELGKISKMFQSGISDFAFKKNVLRSHLEGLESNLNLNLMNNAQITKIIKNQYPFEVEITQNGTTHNHVADTIIIATGFEVFNAEKIEEYGYRYLEGVLTIFDLEMAFQQQKIPINEKTKRIIFVLCVGSRTLKDGGNPDCSAYCCSYSINQALHIKKEFPSIDVVLMYMDIRTVASHEYLYNEARKSGVLFIRGRVSSIERAEDNLITFYEDTLADSQDVLPADLVILAVGGVPHSDCDEIAMNFGVQLTPNRFVKITDKPVYTSTPGIFACGSACDGVKNVPQCLSEGGAAAMATIQFLAEKTEK